MYNVSTKKRKEVKKMGANKIINKFLEPLGITANKGDEFCAYYWEDRIEYPGRYGWHSDAFMEDFNARYPEITTHEYVISILHEVGHCFVNPIEDDENCKVATENPEDYFHKFDERMATIWAAEYIKAHPERIAKFEKKIVKWLEKA